jgi:hypothetical protein
MKKKTLLFCRFAIVLLVLLVCASNITNSFFLKWGFNDKYPAEAYEQRAGLVGLMNGHTTKPFVFRSILPQLIKKGVEQIPDEKRKRLFKSISRYDHLRNSYFNGIPIQFWTADVAITYHLMYLIVVNAALGALWLIYKIAIRRGLSFGGALTFTIGFSLIYPLTFQQGGYYYDFIELLGALSAVYLTLTSRHIAATAAIAVSSLNKETFFLIPLALFFLHPKDEGLKKRLLILAPQLIASLAARLFIMQGYESNGGGIVEWHFFENLRFWINPSSYFSFYNLAAKGVFTPSLQSPLIAIPFVVYLRACWKDAPSNYRHFFLALMLPLSALYVLFGQTDELRAFALSFPAILLIALQGAGKFDAIFGVPHRLNPPHAHPPAVAATSAHTAHPAQ